MHACLVPEGTEDSAGSRWLGTGVMTVSSHVLGVIPNRTISPVPMEPVLSDRTILKRYLFVLSAGVPSKIYHQQVILRGVYTNDLKEILFLFLIVFFVCMKTNTNLFFQNGVSSLDYLEQMPRLLTHVCDSFSHSRESLRISLSLFLFTTFHIKVFRPISCLFHASFFF